MTQVQEQQREIDRLQAQLRDEHEKHKVAIGLWRQQLQQAEADISELQSKLSTSEMQREQLTIQAQATLTRLSVAISACFLVAV